DHVLGLQVPVDDLVVVEVGERLGELLPPLHGLGYQERSSVLAEPAPQVLALDVLQGEVGLAAVLREVDAALHAGVVQVPGDLALPHEALVDGGIGKEERVRALDEHQGARIRVPGLVGLGVRALTERFENLEPIQAVASLQAHDATMLTGASKVPDQWNPARIWATTASCAAGIWSWSRRNPWG